MTDPNPHDLDCVTELDDSESLDHAELLDQLLLRVIAFIDQWGAIAEHEIVEIADQHLLPVTHADVAAFIRDNQQDLAVAADGLVVLAP